MTTRPCTAFGIGCGGTVIDGVCSTCYAVLPEKKGTTMTENTSSFAPIGARLTFAQTNFELHRTNLWRGFKRGDVVTVAGHSTECGSGVGYILAEMLDRGGEGASDAWDSTWFEPYVAPPLDVESFDLNDALDRAERYVRNAKAAIADENERGLKDALARLRAVAADMAELVERW